MYIVVSPAKKLHSEPKMLKSGQEPFFAYDTQQLLRIMKNKTAQDLERLMKISPKLGQLNHERYQSFQLPFQAENSSSVINTFAGDTYVGLDAQDFSAEDIEFGDQHLGILSGLYGLLRPSDWMQEYRLEMGTKLENQRGRNLYQFWGQKIAERINQFLPDKEPVLVNLASKEYFKAVDVQNLKARILTPVFKEQKNGVYKIISFSAKRARGTMARYIIKNRIVDPERLKIFAEDNYRFQADLSSENEWVFIR
tara:strand:+ start:174 stop:932 length:759 start_codon:yes stop_codon:yes gene_type:complete